MSPAGRLCLLTLVGLILPARGQKLENTSISPDYTGNTDISTESELQEETTPIQWETQTQHPSGTNELLTSDPSVDKGLMQDPAKGTTPYERGVPAGKGNLDPAPRSSGSNEDNPFYYDVYTLRKRGLIIAAVLFITGIVILTSGKCRRLPQLCRNICR
ncbi:FXYD domain-containing ion transport regulator 5 isoform X2 [Talpa occidentalis]|nr:FXYD domain-containing ion transport regulator 5 isoform X2 [Talpa occidentalis]